MEKSLSRIFVRRTSRGAAGVYGAGVGGAGVGAAGVVSRRYNLNDVPAAH